MVPDACKENVRLSPHFRSEDESTVRLRLTYQCIERPDTRWHEVQ
jgi:hypothetical protein